MERASTTDRILNEAFATRYSSAQARIRAAQLVDRHHRLLLKLSLNLFRAAAVLQRLPSRSSR